MGYSRITRPGSTTPEPFSTVANRPPMPPGQQTFTPVQPGGFGSYLSNALNGMVQQPQQVTPVQPLQQPDQYRDTRPLIRWPRGRGF